jgi:hypothetical protein
MTPMLALGLRVQAIRQQRDWTQEKLAERCGVNLGYLARVETRVSQSKDDDARETGEGSEGEAWTVASRLPGRDLAPKLTKAIASARLKSDTVDASFVRLKVIQT